MFFSLIYASLEMEEYKGKKSDVSIGYYNMIKLRHIPSNLYLSSIELNYEIGSIQQVIRGIKKGTLAETYWTIFPPINQTISQGTPIQCPSMIRLIHGSTGKHLHSHLFNAHNSTGHEVSGFDGNDTGDHWLVECNGDWKLDTEIKLKHVDTNYYLNANISSLYDKIEGGEFEIYASEKSDNANWIIGGGLFVSADL